MISHDIKEIIRVNTTVLDLTHNEWDPALVGSETKASDMTVSPRKAAPGSRTREAKEEGGSSERI